MAAELVQVSDVGRFDWVRRIQVGRGENPEVLGKVNTGNGEFAPPELPDLIARYGEPPEEIVEVMKCATTPVASYEELEKHRYTFPPEPSTP